MFKNTQTLALVISVFTAPVSADTDQFPANIYEKAAEYLPWEIGKYVKNEHFDIHWENGGESFWYAIEEADGTYYYRVTPSTGVKTKLASKPVIKTSIVPKGQTLSPNGKWGLKLEEGNLVALSLKDGRTRQLTDNAETGYGYATSPDTDLLSLTKKLANTDTAPVGTWSPDGDKFLTYRVDERGLYGLPIVVHTNAENPNHLPYTHYQKTALPGDEKITRAELIIVDLPSGTLTPIDMPGPILAYNAIPDDGLLWSADSKKVYAVWESRDFRTLKVHEADAATGKYRVVATDTGKLPLRHDVLTGGRLDIVGNGEEIILYSERDNWAHFYLYDTETGALKNQITSGKWVVTDIKYIDAKNRWLYFTARGREDGYDPYYNLLYKVRLNGEDLTLLTPEKAHHKIKFSNNNQYFIDEFSTISSPTRTLVKNLNGQPVSELGQANIDALQELGWTDPIRFSVKAADDKTDLYGSLYLPANYDPSKKYPILDAEYAGPQVSYAPLSFLQHKLFAIATAQLGFAVIVVDGRGTPWRGQEFQDHSFGEKFGDPLTVADHIAAIEQLAERYPFIDTSRAGIYGFSWGGYRAARAMLQFPDFFKAGVASAGSHDNYMYIFEHDRWFGTPQEYPNTYKIQSNLPLAKNLKHNLLLIHGDVDDNVNVANTLQLARALIEENKDFDMLIYPGMNHGNLGSQGYFIRRHWDYFVTHLLGKNPPKGVIIPSKN